LRAKVVKVVNPGRVEWQRRDSNTWWCDRVKVEDVEWGVVVELGGFEPTTKGL
jgi:hypothetical protein